MNKIVIRLIIAFCSFIGLFFLLKQANWIEMFKVEQRTESLEEKFGSFIWKAINESGNVVDNEDVNKILDSMVVRICSANYIESSSIQLHIVQSSNVNAYALPGNHIVINTQLILECESPEELCGVLGHELAHIELEHIMKKMVKEIGLATIVGATSGNGGSQVAVEVLRLFTSSAYDRDLEEEADSKALEYLANASINPAPFADFIYRMGTSSGSMKKYISWTSTHPEPLGRAETIANNALKIDRNFEPVLFATTWEMMREYIRSL